MDVDLQQTTAQAGAAIAALGPQFQDLLSRVPPEELELMVDAILSGSRSYADSIGINPEVLANFTRIGYALYESGRLTEAGAVLGLVVQLDQDQLQAWRGLGAILQTQRSYGAARFCYERALDAAARVERLDLPSKVLLGETLLHLGERAQGLKTLREAAASHESDLTMSPYIQRAKAILSAQEEAAPR